MLFRCLPDAATLLAVLFQPTLFSTRISPQNSAMFGPALDAEGLAKHLGAEEQRTMI
jgi:hypothetical protein